MTSKRFIWTADTTPARFGNAPKPCGIDDLNCPKKRRPGTAHTKQSVPLGERWRIERTNSWLTNYGQLRRNTDRRLHHRLAQLALAITLLITAKLIDWRNRYTPTN